MMRLTQMGITMAVQGVRNDKKEGVRIEVIIIQDVERRCALVRRRDLQTFPLGGLQIHLSCTK